MTAWCAQGCASVRDGPIRVLCRSTVRMKLHTPLQGHPGTLAAARKLLVSGSDDTNIRVWDMAVVAPGPPGGGVCGCSKATVTPAESLAKLIEL